MPSDPQLARQRAYRILASNHQEEFDKLFEKERANLGLRPVKDLRRPDVLTEEVARTYLSGQSLNQVARLLGLSGESVRQRLVKAGIPRRRRGRTSTT